MKQTAKFIAMGVIAAAVITVAACQDAATTASHNTSRAADNFEVARRIRVINGITDKEVMKIEGFCSLQKSSHWGRIAVICKTRTGKFLKHFLDKSDNVFVLTEQLAEVNVSTFHTRIFFRPQALIPDIDFQGSADELLNNKNTDG